MSTPVTDRPVAVVTGASSGIGLAIARDLASDHLVIAIARDRAKLDALTAEFPEGVIEPLVLDLADPEEIADTVSALPRVDALIHNAAWMQRSTVETTDVSVWQNALNINVVAPAELSRALLPQLRESSGTIVFISSGAARRSVPFHTVYSATKHALLALTDGLRQQVSEAGIRVATVAPGPTHTPGGARVDPNYPELQSSGMKSEPDAIARSVRHVLEAPEDSQITDVWVRPRAE